MEGLAQDRALMLALVDYTGLSAAEIARKAGLAATTIQRPLKGTADTRISQRTIEKLSEAFPKFPGWTRAGAAAMRSLLEPDSDMVPIAAIDLNFGLGAAFMDSEIVEHAADTMLFPRDWLRSITSSAPDRLYWARGVGNSMEPTIGDGDVILIDRSAVGSTFGDLYWAIAFGHTGMVKRLRPMPDGSVKILSDNPNVPPEVAHDGELHVFGRVIAVVRRI
ncbi:LexA family transcriptional regulator [Erythrobacter colymbi]|uniref:LexA family transcriptional regulator n=1 Tax=Erythrobacter colymbi TaxID=1161202 RepID=UPI001F0ACCB5|nr:LexA family transcriptional regulator [Erythrobacter colymbi]